MTGRKVTQSYDDPLSLIWIAAAARLGYQVERSDKVYASFDGKHTLTISSPAHYDADDNLGQMIFHELCHALVAGPMGRRRSDWGLENIDNRDIVQEQAANRLQAALATPYGLRRFFATTTEVRVYYDTLPSDPLADDSDPAVAIAQRAADEATQEPWSSALQDALAATRELAKTAKRFASPGSLWSAADEPESE